MLQTDNAPFPRQVKQNCNGEKRPSCKNLYRIVPDCTGRDRVAPDFPRNCWRLFCWRLFFPVARVCHRAFCSCLVFAARLCRQVRLLCVTPCVFLHNVHTHVDDVLAESKTGKPRTQHALGSSRQDVSVSHTLRIVQVFVLRLLLANVSTCCLIFILLSSDSGSLAIPTARLQTGLFFVGAFFPVARVCHRAFCSCLAFAARLCRQVRLLCVTPCVFLHNVHTHVDDVLAESKTGKPRTQHALGSSRQDVSVSHTLRIVQVCFFTTSSCQHLYLLPYSDSGYVAMPTTRLQTGLFLLCACFFRDDCELHPIFSPVFSLQAYLQGGKNICGMSRLQGS